MSTKTTFKRIALVAVAALGLGTVSWVPANAAAYTVTTPTVGTAAPTAALVTVSKSTTVGFSLGTALVATDTWSGATISLTRPVGSTVTLADNDGAGGAGVAAFGTASMTTNLGSAITLATGNLSGTLAGTAGGAVAAGAVIAGTVTIVPDVMGTYTIKVTTVADGLSKTSTISASLPFGVTGAVLGSATGNNTAAVSAVQIAGAGNYVSVVASQATPAVAAATDYDYVTVSGSTIVNSVGFSASSPLNSTTVRVEDPNTAISGNEQVWVSAATAGTITVSYVRRSFAAGVATDTTFQTITITVGSNDLDAAKSTAYLGSALVAATTTDATVAPVAFGTTGVVANISLNFLNLLGTAFVGTSPVLTASVTGPGLISKAANAAACTVGTVKAVAITPGTDGAICISSDGTAGTSTISILAGSTVWASKSVVFAGTATAFKVGTLTNTAFNTPSTTTAVTNLGVGEQQWWNVSTVDASGNAVETAPSITVTSSDSTILDTTLSTAGVIRVKGVKAGTATFTVTKSGITTLGPITVNVSDKTIIAAPTVTLDKSEYTVGEKFTMTITAKDANGLPLADGDKAYANMVTVTPNVLLYNATGAILSGAITPSFVGGKATIVGYMPNATGTVSFTVTLGTNGVSATTTGLQGASLTVGPVAVSSSAVEAANAANDAAAEATDAANAATDAANAAAEAADAATAAAQDAADAVAALSAQVAEMISALKKQITALTNLVIKIQKKVKA